MEKTQTYSETRKCPNCLTENKFEIPKGTTISNFLSEVVCSYCRCNIGYLIKKLYK